MKGVAMFRVYIAGPIAADTEEKEEWNVTQALDIAYQLVKAGFAVYLPHAFWYVDKWVSKMELCPLRSYYIAQDLEWLKACDAVIRIKGASIGTDIEITNAKVAGIPVFKEINDLLRAVQQGRTQISPERKCYDYDQSACGI